MLVTKDFVFLHMLKTGGTWIREVFAAEAIPNDLPKHAIANRIPTEHRHKPRLGFVRNPWDWYVSLYEYLSRYHPDEPFWGHMRLTEGFETMLRQAMVPSEPADGYIPSVMRSTGCDYMTAAFEMTFRDTQIGRFEDLRGELADFLARNGIPVSDDVRERLETLPAVNQSDRRPTEDYYTPELRDMVTRRCALVERFKYSYHWDRPEAAGLSEQDALADS